jgi:hypothetical protein
VLTASSLDDDVVNAIARQHVTEQKSGRSRTNYDHLSRTTVDHHSPI